MVRVPPSGTAKSSVRRIHVPQDDAVLLPFDSEATADLPADSSHPHATKPEARNAIAGEIALASGVLDRHDP